MSKHTPGPWQVDDCNKGIWVETRDEVAVCRILRDGNWTMDQARQHARLIAAAPELLDILERAVRRLEIAHANGDSIMREWIVDARAAITKATGEKQ